MVGQRFELALQLFALSFELRDERHGVLEGAGHVLDASSDRDERVGLRSDRGVFACVVWRREHKRSLGPRAHAEVAELGRRAGRSRGA